MILDRIEKLFLPITTLPKIGNQIASFLSKINCKKIIDLIFHLPSNVIIIKQFPKLKEIRQSDQVILEVTIQSIDEKPRNKIQRKKPFKILCCNNKDYSYISLVYFNYYPDYIVRNLKISDKKIIRGRVDFFNNEPTIAHPEFITVNSLTKTETIYPTTAGIVSKQLQNYIKNALEYLPILPEWLKTEMLLEQEWPNFNEALVALHNPRNLSDLNLSNKNRSRLSYDELLANQLVVMLMRYYKSKAQGRKFQFTGYLQKQILYKLGFTLTNGQQSALSEIAEDQKSINKMFRLIQGDVGSGKTLIALCAILNVIESGVQVCLMAPTDVLASQHYKWISSILSGENIATSLLTGKIKGKIRKEIFEKLKKSEIKILIGTHALFQENVEFYDLGLVIIDEQHRFGVEQRAALYNKGNNADLIVMTATPIPRTLMLSLYGDMDTTKINDKPIGRLPITTSIMSLSKIKEIILSLENIIEQGSLIYWICPLIEENDEQNSAAITRYNFLSTKFPDKVGLVHGKLKSEEKDKVINDFANGIFKILVATTVIEVGIDVKDADIIIIEQAEKFGLSQLHQLRGRVGRGTRKSYCILLYSEFLSEIAMQKLRILRETNDGFIVAEEDLRLRGAGDIAGKKQSGLPTFKFADLSLHHDLLLLANTEAKEIVNQNPKLENERGEKLRILLKLFDYNSSNLWR